MINEGKVDNIKKVIVNLNIKDKKIKQNNIKTI